MANEKPLTKVHLKRYFISRFPITNAQYEMFDPSHKTKRLVSANELCPVVYVSSLEAIKFCQWLGTREKKAYRLPTEAEWEYAARGNTARKYPWGDVSNRGDLANFADGNTKFPWSDAAIDDGFAECSPVGAYPRSASAFGIEDMAGNVWEWCLDFYEEYRGGERENPTGPKNGAKRVYRGGSWRSRFTNMRTTARNSNTPEYLSNDVGFRIICECE